MLYAPLLLCTHQVKTFCGLNVLILSMSPLRPVWELVSVKASSHCFLSMSWHQWWRKPLGAWTVPSVLTFTGCHMAEWLTEWESKDYTLPYLCDGVESCFEHSQIRPDDDWCVQEVILFTVAEELTQTLSSFLYFHRGDVASFEILQPHLLTDWSLWAVTK